MSYQERRAIAYLVSAILIPALYLVYVLQRYPEGNVYSADVFRFWGTAIVVLIPVFIAAKIAVHIAFNMVYTMATNDKERSLSDERDRLIELRGIRNTYYVFMAGFVLAMASLVVAMPPSVMFIVLFCSVFVSELVGDISQLYFYRRGF